MRTIARAASLAAGLIAGAAACSSSGGTAPPDRPSASSGAAARLWILNQSGASFVGDFFSCVLSGSNWNDLAAAYPYGESLDLGGQVIRNDDPCTANVNTQSFYQCAVDAGSFDVRQWDVLLVLVPDSGFGGENGTAAVRNPATGATVTISTAYVRTSTDPNNQTIYGGHEVFEAQSDGNSADCCDGETSTGGPFPVCPQCGPWDGGAGACGKYAPGGTDGSMGIDTIVCPKGTYKYQRVGPANHEFDGTCSAVVPKSNGDNPCARVPSADDGVYCGTSTQNGFAGGSASTLYDCRDGQLTSTLPCATGCVVAAAGQADTCNTDPCAGVSAADAGVYCGASHENGFAGGNPSTLYTCSGGTTKNTQPCPKGCFVAPSGQADGCVSNPCASVPSASDGFYCGSSSQSGFADGAANVLYACQNGQVASMQTCANGCVVAAAGQPDHCG
jgi:hypothetical protein